jgi:NAD(P)-dependent dehydrogenase (short-subunit alcohol dehydrogenase family)
LPQQASTLLQQAYTLLLQGHQLVTTVDLEGMRKGKGRHWYAWSMFGAYCQSKLAGTIFSNELHRRLSSRAHVEVVSMHPGFCGTEGVYILFLCLFVGFG